MGIRDGGFGLNFDQGFGRGPMVITGGGADQRLQQDAYRAQADQAARRRQFGYDTRLQDAGLQQRERESSRDAGLRQQELGLRQQQMGQQDAISRAQIDASLQPLQFEREKYNQLSPLVQQQIGRLGNWASGYQGGGQTGSQPGISDAPVYDENQVRRQVNQGRAVNDQQTFTQTRGMQQQLAGRGFGSRSPLALALGQGYENQNLATNAQTETDLRTQAATANASQVLRAQQAREQQFASRQQEDIQRNQVSTGGISALLSALM